MRLTTVQVGALAAASANNIALSQSVPGAAAVVLDGSLTTGYSATALAASQTVSGAADLTLTAQAANVGGRSVVIVSAANDSGITFTVKGTDVVGAYLSETLTGANASRTATRNLFYTVTAISTSGSTAGNVTAGLNGAIATLDRPRRVLLTSGGTDTSRTFTVTGTDWNGTIVSERLAGGSSGSPVFTVYDYATVTSITVTGATASTLTVGTNTVASSRPIRLDGYAMAPTSIQVNVSGTVNYTVQQAVERVNDVGYTNLVWINHPDTTLVSATASAQGNYAYVPSLARIVLNSGTGSVTMNILQASGTPV